MGQFNNNLKQPNPSKNIDTYLWCLRLGQISQERIQRIVKDGPLMDLRVDPLLTYKSCLEGKMTKMSFSGKGDLIKEILELVHSDVPV